MKKLVTTPLTNTIWWATINEEKGIIIGNKKDVTDDAIDAVFQHLIGLKEFEDKGFAGYKIPKKNSDEYVTMAVFKNSTHVCITNELYNDLLRCKKKYEEVSNKRS